MDEQHVAGWDLIAQGAEAVSEEPSGVSKKPRCKTYPCAAQRVFRCTFLSRPAIVKERFKKLYRHPVLDEKLTKERMTLEGRCLVRAHRAGVDTPVLYFVDVPKLR